MRFPWKSGERHLGMGWRTLALSAGAIVTVCAINIMAIYPRFADHLIRTTEQEAIREAHHLIQAYHVADAPLDDGNLAANLTADTEFLHERLDLWALKVFAPSGEIVYSMNPDDIGKVNTKPYFVNQVAHGEVFTKIAVKDGQTTHGEIAERDVVETYVPLMNGSEFLGAFEIYYDITDHKATLAEDTMMYSALTGGVALVLLAALVMATWQARKETTARIVAEERHDQLEEHMRKTEKLRALGELAGGVAHDFNNQLTAILGWSELLRKRLLADPVAVKMIDAVTKSGRSSAELVGQLLAFARRGKHRASNVELHDVISEVVSLLRHSIDKKIRIERHLTAESSATIGDATQLQSALLNIALNSRDAIEGAGAIVISSETVTLDEETIEMEHHEFAPGRYIVITIADDGVGMTDSVRGRVFEPFFTANRNGNGNGMGMAAAYGTISNHGGGIEVESAPGAGTRVFVYLPLSKAAGDAADAEKRNEPGSGTGRVMIVDDEDCVRAVIAAMLKSYGYTVAAFSGAAKALEYYERHWAQIELVVLDMVMPQVAGREVFEELRKMNPDVRAVLVSGYALNAEVQATLDHGALAFLQKPFEPEDLARVLEGVRRLQPA